MPKQLRLNAFDMNCVGHIQHGMWRHPRDQSRRYTDIDYWMDLARTLERGFFDGIFLADILGVYDVYRGDGDTSIRESVQIPVNDPLLLVPAMAAVTKHLGFGVTCNLTYEAPYTFARRMSTLDHLTRGRIGWNIVTGYLDSAARGMGDQKMIGHDDRYDMADEYMEIVYRLWEGSWQDDAVRNGRDAGPYADPAKLHRVRYEGTRYKVDALHLSEPSPQRTPVLYQAGASTRGRRFAAKHAECVFLAEQSKRALAATVADIRAQAAGAGRDAAEVLMFQLATVVVGRTEKEARDKLEDYRRCSSVEGALAHFSASLGIDLGGYALDEPIRHVKTDANNSFMDAITRRTESTWTRRRIMDQVVLGSRWQPTVGSAEQVADALIEIMESTGIDGFNLSRTVMPECVEDFVDLVVPVLQERGRYKSGYETGTLREKLYGAGRARLPACHPAAAVSVESR